MECAPQSVMDAINYQQQQRAHNEHKRSLIQFLSSAPQYFHLTGESVILGPKAKVAQKMEHDVKVLMDLCVQIKPTNSVGLTRSLTSPLLDTVIH